MMSLCSELREELQRSCSASSRVQIRCDEYTDKQLLAFTKELSSYASPACGQVEVLTLHRPLNTAHRTRPRQANVSQVLYGKIDTRMAILLCALWQKVLSMIVSCLHRLVELLEHLPSETAQQLQYDIRRISDIKCAILETASAKTCTVSVADSHGAQNNRQQQKQISELQAQVTALCSKISEATLPTVRVSFLVSRSRPCPAS